MPRSLARSRPASTGSTPRRSTATAPPRRRSAAIISLRSRRGPMSPPRCGSRPRTSATSRAPSSAAWSTACGGCKSDRLTLLQLHNHLGEGVGARIALRPEQVLGRGGVADTFDRLGSGPRSCRRPDGRRRHQGVPPGDRQRPLRHRAGLLQRHQSERGLATPACGMARRTGLLRRPCRVLRRDVGVLNIRVWARRCPCHPGAARAAVRDDRGHRRRQRDARGRRCAPRWRAKRAASRPTLVRAPDACPRPPAPRRCARAGGMELDGGIMSPFFARFEEHHGYWRRGRCRPPMSSLDALSGAMGLGLVDAMGDMHYSA